MRHPFKKDNRRHLSKTASRHDYQKLEPRQLLAADLFITEFMASNKVTITDGNDNSTDWIEIHNAGDESANLLGYSLTDNPTNPAKFVLPTQTIAPGEYLVVYASGDNAPDAAGNIHTNFKLSASGEYVGFFDPNGVVVSEFGTNGTDYPRQLTDVSYGLDIVAGDYLRTSQRYFVLPTPGTVNTPNAADLAPLIDGIEKPTTAAIDGQSIVVTAQPIVVSGVTLTNVRLFARVDYGSEIQLTMVDNGSGNDAISGDGIYTATISAALFGEGDMVRWRITATANNGLTGRRPTFLDPLKSPEYFGTVVEDTSINTPLPVIQWFSNGGSRGSAFYTANSTTTFSSGLVGNRPTIVPRKI